jgi:hypothetical protein
VSSDHWCGINNRTTVALGRRTISIVVGGSRLTSITTVIPRRA